VKGVSSWGIWLVLSVVGW